MMSESVDSFSPTTEEEDPVDLFSLLQDRNEIAFSQQCANHRGRLDENNGEYTYLQLACLYGLPEAVKALLTNGADPNLTYHPDQCSPIMMAGQQGYLNIVEILAQHNGVNFNSTAKGTVLHAVLEGMSKDRDRGDLDCNIGRYINCLKLLLLEEHSSNSLDINARNEDGLTALHLAVKLHEKSIILLLLEHGAYIGAKGQGGYKIISLLDANEFEEYLNNCIFTNGKLPIDKDYKITYDYRFLDPLRIYRNKPKVGKSKQPILISETEPLIELSGVPELRHLITHPVLTSFLNMKWLTVREYFWANFIFYLTFWLSLTLHTLAVYSPLDSDVSNLELPERRKRFVANWTWYPSVILCGLLGLRESFKFIVSPIRYAFNVENLLDVAVLTSNLLILFLNVEAGYAAIALLLTWTEMVLLINRHPSLASNIVMYKVVCANFLKLFAWWSMLIVAFALSFHLLFKDANTDKPICAHQTTAKNDDVSKFFENTVTSLFKVMLMMTGEFETSSIPFHCNSGVSHVVFIVFVFLVSIVLFNLMNGLAVSDTLAIRKDALIIANGSLAKQIAYIETMVNHLEIFDNLLCCVTSNPIARKWLSTSVFYKHVNLFPYVLPDSCVHTLPNQHSRVVFSNHLGQQEAKIFRWIPFYRLYTRWCIVSSITNATKKVLHARKSEKEENERFSALTNTYSKQWEHFSKKMDTFSGKLDQHEIRLILVEKTTIDKLNMVLELIIDKKTEARRRTSSTTSYSLYH